MLNTRISGQEIVGRIRKRTAEELEVELLSPYRGVTISAHIPKFILPYTSFVGRYGDEWADKLLEHAYEMCEYTMLNIDRLVFEYMELKRALAALADKKSSDDAFDARRFFLKMRFFQTNYPNMNIQENSWDGLLSLIEDTIRESSFPIVADTCERKISRVNDLG